MNRRIKLELLNCICGVLVVISNATLGFTNGMLKKRNYLLLKHPQRTKEVKL